MTVTRNTCVVLGAVVGIATVYLTPCLLPGKTDKKPKETRNKGNPIVIVHRPDENKEINENSAILLGYQTILDIFDRVRAEVSRLWSHETSHDQEAWNIKFRHDENSAASSIYHDAKSELQDNINKPIPSYDEITHKSAANDSTDYCELPSRDSLYPLKKKRKVKEKFHKFYKDINYTICMKDEKQKQSLPPKSSTFIDLYHKKSPHVFPAWETSYEENSPSSIQNSNIKRSKTPIQRICQIIKSCWLMKKKSHHKSDVSYVQMNEDINNNNSKEYIIIRK